MDQFSIKPKLLLKPEGVKDSQEVIEKRQIDSKTYQIAPNKFKIRKIFGAAHYKNNPDDENEKWKDIDLTIDSKGRVNKTHYDIQIFKDKVGYSYISKRGGRVDVELVEIGGNPIDNNKFKVRIEGNVIWWDGVDTDLDLKIILRPLSAEIFKKIGSSKAPKKFKWKVTEDVDTQAEFQRKTGGLDKDKKGLEIVNTKTKDVVKTSSSTGNKYKEFYMTESWTGKVGEKKNKETRQKEWTENVTYPVIIDATTQELIVNTVDDGKEIVGNVDWDSTGSIFILGNYAGYDRYHGGIRFRALGIPQGSTINSSTLTLKKVSGPGNPQLKIYGDDVDDAALWSNGNLPSGVTKTEANVAWTPPLEVAATTISITNIVQEIISRGGWASGDIRFAILDQLGTGTNYIRIRDYDSAQADAAVLDVDYSLAPVTKTFTVDGIIFSEGTKDFTVDGIVLAVQTETITADGIVSATNTKTFTVDAIVDNNKRYWIGGAGNWSDTDNWSFSSGGSGGAPVPDASDDVIIDANSGFGGGGTITTDVTHARCHDFTCTSGHSYSIGGNYDFHIYGSLTLESGITLATATMDFNFYATDAGNTITTDGVTLPDAVEFYGTGEWTLQDDLTITGQFYQENGTFDANDNNVTADNCNFYAATGYTPTVIMGSGTWTLSGDWSIFEQDGEVVTVTSETSKIVITENQNFYAAGKVYYDLECQEDLVFYGSATFHDLTLVNTGSGYTFESGETYTITGDFIANGSSGNLIGIWASSAPTQAILSKSSGIVECDYLDISNSNAIGGAGWYAGANSVDTTNNDRWIFIAGPSTKTFTTDGIVKEIKTKTFTLDGVVRVETVKTFIVDGIVEAVGTSQLSADGIVKTSYYKLGGLVIPRPNTLTRGFVFLKTDAHTLTGKTGRDISYRKEKYRLGWDNLIKSDADRILSIVNLNQPVDFEVNAGSLQISSVSVIVNLLPNLKYTMLGSDYRVSLVLELIEEEV